MYEPDLDIKDLISLEDVMEEISLGPNGGLIYCFEYDNQSSLPLRHSNVGRLDFCLRILISSPKPLIH